ncbi:hypothetical protein J6Q66_09005 [bacterium]|nr:hypothetical protein [bacterium]
MKHNKLIMVGDFETTIYDNQTETEVWASALVELYKDNPIVLPSLPDTFYYLLSLNRNVTIYYHNLKFDGSFWLDYLYRHQNFKNAFDYTTNTFKEDKDMNNNEVKYIISDFGEWYTIKFKVNGHIIELRDSLKLIRMSVEQIGKKFNTKHKKTKIEYIGYRKAGQPIPPHEIEYIKNDVLVVKEALEIFYNQNHKNLTIGSCCMKEFKQSMVFMDFDAYFPNLDYEIDGINVDWFVRQTYKGGWCYVKEGVEKKLWRNGSTYDNNSLYPSRQLTEYFPTGKPQYFKGKPPFKKNKYTFLHFKAKFFLKRDYLPTILVKSGLRGGYSHYAKNSLPSSLPSNNFKVGDFDFDDHMELYMTQHDFDLFKKHYEIIDIEFFDYLEFGVTRGSALFGPYLEKYKKIKENSTGGTREVAKLFSNNLGGKFGTSPNASFKICSLNEDKVSFETIKAFKDSVYCPVASVMTATGRYLTITSAQKNYKHFLYSDTDSIHLSTRNPVGIEIHPSKYGAWKCESEWDLGWFVRQKTYIEITNGETNFYDVKCAGMPEICKKSLIQDFVEGKKTIFDFKEGLQIFGKLMTKRIKGGVILYPDWFTLKKRKG